MGTQVPLWVTITLGVIAIAGPIGGAWVGGFVVAKRDDQRWKLQQERDDRIWSRQRRLDDEKYWRERRIETYASMIDRWNRFNHDTGRMLTAIKFKHADVEAKNNMVSSAESLLQSISRVRVEASGRTQSLLENLNLMTAELVYKALDLSVGILGGERTSTHTVEELESLARESEDLERQFVELVRGDLAVPVD